MNKHLGKLKVYASGVSAVKPSTSEKDAPDIIAGLCLWTDLGQLLAHADVDDLGSRKIMLFAVSSEPAAAGMSKVFLCTTPHPDNNPLDEANLEPDESVEYTSVSVDVLMPAGLLGLYYASSSTAIPFQIMLLDGRPPRGWTNKVLSSDKVIALVSSDHVDFNETLTTLGMHAALRSPLVQPGEVEEFEDGDEELDEPTRAMLWNALTGASLGDVSSVNRLETVADWAEANSVEGADQIKNVEDLFGHIVSILSASGNSLSENIHDYSAIIEAPKFDGVMGDFFGKHYVEDCYSKLLDLKVPTKMFVMRDDEDGADLVVSSLGVIPTDEFNVQMWSSHIVEGFRDVVEMYGVKATVLNACFIAMMRASVIKDIILGDEDDEYDQNSFMRYSWIYSLWLTTSSEDPKTPVWMFPALGEAIANFDTTVAADLLSPSDVFTPGEASPLLSKYIHESIDAFDTLKVSLDDFSEWIKASGVKPVESGRLLKLLGVLAEVVDEKKRSGSPACLGCEFIERASEAGFGRQDFVEPFILFLPHLADFHSEKEMGYAVGDAEWAKERKAFLHYWLDMTNDGH